MTERDYTSIFGKDSRTFAPAVGLFQRTLCRSKFKFVDDSIEVYYEKADLYLLFICFSQIIKGETLRD